MIRFSANLGFLWPELDLPQAILAAGHAGFQAVECHWPFASNPAEVKAALTQAKLPMLGLNTRQGDVAGGDNGVAAIPGREAEARNYIDEAINYAREVNCANIHVMAGFTDKGAEADTTFAQNLLYACRQAYEYDMNILIEPLNHYDAPGYHLQTIDDALNTMSVVDAPNLKLMFDCYHLQIMQGDLTRRLQRHLNDIGHIQIASVPDRNEPDSGEIHYPNLLRTLDDIGWTGYIGAEYKPRTTTAEGLDWLKSY